MNLFFDRMETPLGDIVLSFDKAGKIYSLDWKNPGRSATHSAERYYKNLQLEHQALPPKISNALHAYFDGDLKTIEGLAIHLDGTPFQNSVWRALCEIPVGEVCSYVDIAKKLNNPGAMRAVGMANNANPISIIVPCHRVIGADGKMVGYGSGVDRKKWLLRHEGYLDQQPALF